MQTSTQATQNEVVLSLNTFNSSLWHQRFGHLGETALKYLPQAVKELPTEKITQQLHNNTDCEICIQSKQTATPSRQESTPKNEFLELVVTDLCTLELNSYKGHKYFITFLDFATRWLEGDLLAYKSEAFNSFESYKRKAEKQSGKGLKILKSDNGREFKNDKFHSLCQREGVIHQYSAPYAHEQNGLAERINRTLMNKVRALLFDAKQPTELWDEALEAAIYLYNRTPHQSLNFKTPFEARYGEKPDISNVRTWGSKTYYKSYPQPGKLDQRGNVAVLIGYGSNQYKLFIPESRRTIWARDVTILEGQFLEENQDAQIQGGEMVELGGFSTSPTPSDPDDFMDEVESDSTSQQIEQNIKAKSYPMTCLMMTLWMNWPSISSIQLLSKIPTPSETLR